MTTEKLAALGLDLRGKLKERMTDRRTLEQQFLKNLRQYRSQYDPEVLAVLNSPEYATRSKTYPRDTHVKVVGFVAKMMEMMFPAAEKNWSLAPTPFPNIAQGDLQRIIDGLKEQKLAEFQAAQQQGQPVAQPAAITSDEIEEAVKEFALARSEQMEKEIEDQLADIGGDRIEYPQLVKKVLRSAGIYGYGCLEGPLVRTQKERRWVPDATGNYQAQQVDIDRPYLEHVKVWDLYPDLMAKSWREQSGIYRRRVFLKAGLMELADRKPYRGDVIRQFVKDHPTGNYTAMDYENELDSVNVKSSSTRKKEGRFEVFRCLVTVPAKTLSGAGVELPDGTDPETDVLADIWLLDEQVIYADVAPMGNNPADYYFVFVSEDDEESGLTGVGLPELIRDSQMRLCSIDRATMDNMAAVAGPITETNIALLGRGRSVGMLHSFMNIERDDDNPQTAALPAIKSVNVNTHIQDYLALRAETKNILDFESNLPAMLFGDTQGMGEAFRTSNNMSMMTGAANMVTKDVVRSFDRFTVSVIGALVQWNMEFNDKAEIKGDFQVQPKGALSLVAKEIRGAALDQLWMTMEPEDKAIVKRRKVLLDRFKSRDLPEDYIEDDATARQILDSMAQAAAASKQTEDALTQAKTQKEAANAKKSDAQAQELLAMLQEKIGNARADIEQKLTNAKGVKDRGNLEHVKLLLDSLAGKGAGAGEGTQGAAGDAGAQSGGGAAAA